MAEVGAETAEMEYYFWPLDWCMLRAAAAAGWRARLRLDE